MELAGVVGAGCRRQGRQRVHRARAGIGSRAKAARAASERISSALAEKLRRRARSRCCASRPSARRSGEALRRSAALAVLAATVDDGHLHRHPLRLALRHRGGVALLHDVLITLGALSILNLEFDLTTVAALLTVVGYSVNDTVVISDRIRENLRKMRREPLATVMNLSHQRDALADDHHRRHGFIATAALFFLGGAVIHSFAFTLLFGFIVGTYSSIFVASPIVLYLERDARRRLSRGRPGPNAGWKARSGRARGGSGGLRRTARRTQDPRRRARGGARQTARRRPLLARACSGTAACATAMPPSRSCGRRWRTGCARRCCCGHGTAAGAPARRCARARRAHRRLRRLRRRRHHGRGAAGALPARARCRAAAARLEPLPRGLRPARRGDPRARRRGRAGDGHGRLRRRRTSRAGAGGVLGPRRHRLRPPSRARHAPARDGGAQSAACRTATSRSRGCRAPGVVFYLLMGLRMELRARGHGPLPDLRRYLDLVALGTVADVVPLREENRVLVAHGLRGRSTAPRGPGCRRSRRPPSWRSAPVRCDRFPPRAPAQRRRPARRRAAGGRAWLVTSRPDEARALAGRAWMLQRRAARHRGRTIGGRGVSPRRRMRRGGARFVVATRRLAPGRRRHRRGAARRALLSAGAGDRARRTISARLGRGAFRRRRSPRRGERMPADCSRRSAGIARRSGFSLRRERIDALAERLEATDVDDDGRFVRPGVADRCPARTRRGSVGGDRCEALVALEPHGPGNPEPLFLARDVACVEPRSVGDPRRPHLRLRLSQDGRTVPAIAFRTRPRAAEPRRRSARRRVHARTVSAGRASNGSR